MSTRKVLIYVFVIVCNLRVFGHLNDPSHWNSSPAIDVSGILKAHDQEWFHISQSCDLTIVATDEDTHCGESPSGDYIDGEECEWYGENLLDTEGLSVTWSTDHWTAGDTISACVEDGPDAPAGSYSDDGSENTPSVTLPERFIHRKGRRQKLMEKLKQTEMSARTLTLKPEILVAGVYILQRQ